MRADLMRLSALEFEPGSAFNYSNNNVSLRQFIVERITATTFNRFVVERMFRPCGMTSSTLNPSADAPKIAKSFNNFFRQDPTDVPITGRRPRRNLPGIRTKCVAPNVLRARVLEERRVLERPACDISVLRNRTIQPTQTTGLGER